MKPALSIVAFTVLSGAGFGLFALLALNAVIAGSGTLSASMQLAGGVIALGLVALGLLSSTLHLANPRNAWRAFRQVRYSWLSREAVLALVFFVVALLFLFGVWRGAAPSSAQTLLGLLAALLATITIYSTAMIYACLRTIPQWHTPMVPVAYLALGYFSGALLLLALAMADGKASGGYLATVVVTLLGAAAVKILYFQRFGSDRSGQRTLKHALGGQALGATAAQAKLLEVGHASRTFLTDEFIFALGREHARTLRLVFMVLSFLIPAAALLIGLREPWLLCAVAVVAIIGLLVERWLFFAEAQHVVRLYHGQPSA